MSIENEVAAILAGLPEFLLEPPQATLEQRLRAFLVARLGPGWQDCALQSHLLPTGQMVHVALLPEDTGENGIGMVDEVGISIFVIARDANGNFQLSPPSPVQDEPAALRMPPLQVDCISQIGEAFTEITMIVSQSTRKKRRKSWLIGQLTHAYQHLCNPTKGE